MRGALGVSERFAYGCGEGEAAGAPWRGVWRAVPAERAWRRPPPRALGATDARRGSPRHTPRPYDPAYSASTSASYFAAIPRRFSFIVGVSSSPPGSHSVASTRKRLICSTRDRRLLAASTSD